MSREGGLGRMRKLMCRIIFVPAAVFSACVVKPATDKLSYLAESRLDP